MTDSQLLACFVADQDETAFHGLVTRHGPAVLRLCRSILLDPHEAEDAFQATFLTLVLKAPTIRDPDALGPWLHGVAYRISSRARRRSIRRREYEGRRAKMQREEHEADDPTQQDLRRVLRDEIGRLPEAYRIALELCYLQNLTHDEAAERLGWPLGTVKVRLVRGRRLLRKRLDRRGVSLAVLLLLLRPGQASASVPQRLVDSTVRGMNLAHAGEEAALRVHFSRPAAMARQALRVGSGSRWFWAVLCVFGALTLAGGLSALQSSARAADEARFQNLPAGLRDVLNVDCR